MSLIRSLAFTHGPREEERPRRAKPVKRVSPFWRSFKDDVHASGGPVKHMVVNFRRLEPPVICSGEECPLCRASREKGKQ